MKTKHITIIVLFVALAGLCCFLGYRLHAQREFWRREELFDIATHVSFFRAAERGAYQNEGRDIREDFATLVTLDLLVYTNEFGDDLGINVTFAEKFAAAKVIAHRLGADELRPVSSVSTNMQHRPNTAPEPTPTAP